MLDSTTKQADEVKKMLPSNYNEIMIAFWRGHGNGSMVKLPGYTLMNSRLQRTSYIAMNSFLEKYTTSLEQSQSWAKMLHHHVTTNNKVASDLAEETVHGHSTVSQLIALLDTLDPRPVVPKVLNGSTINVTYTASLSEHLYAKQAGVLRQYQMYNESDVLNMTKFFIGAQKRSATTQTEPTTYEMYQRGERRRVRSACGSHSHPVRVCVCRIWTALERSIQTGTKDAFFAKVNQSEYDKHMAVHCVMLATCAQRVDHGPN